MEDPQEDLLAVHCFCVCSGSALLGDLLGELDLQSVLSIYPRIFLCLSGALSNDAVSRLSIAYITPNSKTESSRKTKIGTQVAHVTRTPLSRSKINLQGRGNVAVD